MGQQIVVGTPGRVMDMIQRRALGEFSLLPPSLFFFLSVFQLLFLSLTHIQTYIIHIIVLSCRSSRYPNVCLGWSWWDAFQRVQRSDLRRLSEASLEHPGDPLIGHHACRRTRGHKAIHEGANQNLGQEGGADSWGYQAVLHPSGEGGVCVCVCVFARKQYKREEEKERERERKRERERDREGGREREIGRREIGRREMALSPLSFPGVEVGHPLWSLRDTDNHTSCHFCQHTSESRLAHWENAL